jgi:AraC family transcriptional regulator
VYPHPAMRETPIRDITRRLHPPVPVTLGSARATSREVGGLLVTDAYFPPGLHLPMHTHERATVAIMLEGSFDCAFPGRTLACGPGALHTEPAEERHANQVGHKGAHVLVIQPHPQTARVFGRHVPLLDQINHWPRTVAVGLGWRLVRELSASDSAAPLAIEGLALELLAEVTRAITAGPSPRPCAAWLLRAREYVHDNFRKSFTIGEVALEVGVNPVRLARAFRRHFGVALGEYTRNLKLEWAGEQLRASHQALSVIASHAGFADQSHFTRVFHRHTGLTPQRYREAVRP